MTTSLPDPLHACAFSLHSLSYVVPSLPHTFWPDDGHSSSRGQRHSWWPLALTKHWEFGAKHLTKSQITEENKSIESANGIKSNSSFLTLTLSQSVCRTVSQPVMRSVSEIHRQTDRQTDRQSVIQSISQSINQVLSTHHNNPSFYEWLSFLLYKTWPSSHTRSSSSDHRYRRSSLLSKDSQPRTDTRSLLCCPSLHMRPGCHSWRYHKEL